MIVYPPIFYGAKLKLAFKDRLTWKVADTLHYLTSDQAECQGTRASCRWMLCDQFLENC